MQIILESEFQFGNQLTENSLFFNGLTNWAPQLKVLFIVILKNRTHKIAMKYCKIRHEKQLF